MADISNKEFAPVEFDNTPSRGRVQLWRLPILSDGTSCWEKDGYGIVTAQFTKFDNDQGQNTNLLLVVHSEEDGKHSGQLMSIEEAFWSIDVN